MTDWLPWGGVLMAGVLSTLGLLLRAVERAPAGRSPDLGPARWVLRITAVLAGGTYLMYLVAGERWLWYE